MVISPEIGIIIGKEVIVISLWEKNNE